MMLDKPFTVLALAALGLAACDRAEAPRPAAPKLAAAPAAGVRVDPGIAGFYRDRGHRPIWVAGGTLRPAALGLAEALRDADSHGLDPQLYGAAELDRALADAKSGDRAALARAELLLSRGYVAFVRDLRVPGRAAMNYIEPALAPAAPAARDLLEGAAAAPSLHDHLVAAMRMNPLYQSLRRGYAQWRAKPARTPREEALIRANLDRARAIPSQDGRYIIVDAGSARLWMVENGRAVDGMKVIVGKPGMQTPAMAGMIGYSVLNPYWNLPPDLARDRARRVLRQGTSFLARERLQILSDWGDHPRVLAPSQVDWRAVAAGRRTLRMRQLPGGANVMGAVKFMLPNELGIYLHDFPDKSLFGRADRRISSGCVRVADASRLARWLYGGAAPRPAGARPEQRVDLPQPVPVYITYMTALPAPGGGIAFQSDAYRRDRAMLARLEPRVARRG
jgi:murein L,D-transpeptidase YcbB/YkuD